MLAQLWSRSRWSPRLKSVSTLVVLIVWLPIFASAFAPRSSPRPRALLLLNDFLQPCQGGETETIDALQGKLRVLEDVVNELYRRQNESKEIADATDCKQQIAVDQLRNQLKRAKEKEEMQAEAIRSVKANASSRDSQRSRQIDILEAQSSANDEQIQEYEGEIERLGYELQQKTKDLESLHAVLQEKAEQINRLRNRASTSEVHAEEWRNRMNECEETRKLELHKVEKKTKVRFESLEETIASLKSELSAHLEKENEHEERIEIAMAAVRGAEQREKAAIMQSTDAQKELTRAQFQASLQRLKVRCLEDEQISLEKDFESCKQTFQHEETKLGKANQGPSLRQSVRRIWPASFLKR